MTFKQWPTLSKPILDAALVLSGTTNELLACVQVTATGHVLAIYIQEDAYVNFA